jgi:sirohydrochlorin cobaltochelatase
MKPSLDEVIDRFAADGFTSIRILTLFLAAGGHTRRDLTAIVEGAAERWPACQFDVSPTLTESAEIRHAIVRWAAQEAVPGGVAAGD